MRRRRTEWTSGRKWAAAALVPMLVCGLVLRADRVAVALIFLAISAAFLVVGITVDKRWR